MEISTSGMLAALRSRVVPGQPRFGMAPCAKKKVHPVLLAPWLAILLPPLQGHTAEYARNGYPQCGYAGRFHLRRRELLPAVRTVCAGVSSWW